MNGRTFLNDAQHYDAFHAHVKDDIPFWTAWASRTGGPVLVLGCGTGRLAVPMEAAGREVWGIDISEEFLRHAKSKSPTLQLRSQDIRHFQLDKQFPLIALPYRVVASLLTLDDVRACFRSVRQHLTPAGYFILDTYTPADRATPKTSDLQRHFEHPNEGPIDFQLRTYYDPESRIVNVDITYLRPEEPLSRGELKLRHHTVEELQDALTAEGFSVGQVLGNYDGRNFKPKAKTLIIVAQPALSG